MLLLLIWTSCFSYELKFPRRAKKVSFDVDSNIQKRSIDDSWYFINFNFNGNGLSESKKEIIQKLQNQGIYLNAENLISKNIYNLFLTPSQVNFIRSNNYGKALEVESDNKVTNSPDGKWSILSVEASDPESIINDYNAQFKNSKCDYNFKFTTSSTFSVQGNKKCLSSLVEVLTQDKRIYSVAYSNEGEILNCRVSGFTQKNTYESSALTNSDGSHIIDFNRFLNKQGLDGTGVTILVADTFLDTNSTYFYDPECPKVEINKKITNHRKLVYISATGKEPCFDNEHGTHTAGTITGRALNESSPAAKYNGNAYGSKLAFYTSNDQNFDLKKITETVDIVKPHISSNSWGLDRDTIVNDRSWDMAQFERPDTLFVFAAGNSGLIKKELDGYETLRSPGSAKNVLTVGAISQISIDEEIIGKENRDVYIIIGSDQILLKILDWSNTNFENNPGLNSLFNVGRLKITTTRDPKENKPTDVLIIDTKEQFDALSKDSPPYFVITTTEFTVNNFEQMGFKHTFPVMYLENSSVPKYQGNSFYTNYVINKTYSKADFSSQGTGSHGIMKPDIMCPGVNVLSAQSLEKSEPNHEGLTYKYGTSMATPTCAGATALVYQYFMEGKYRKTPTTISAALARSFMINSADPMKTKHPDASTGFGKINLGKYIGNGEDVDNKRILIGEHLKITDKHLMSTVSLKKASDTNDFRITLSYLDLSLSSDSAAALAVDIDLVIVDPNNVVYRGNLREDNTEEHYSTNERVIIDHDDIVDGNYEIHVFTSYPSNLENSIKDVEFAVTIFGPLNDDKKLIQFEKATKCIPVDAGSGSCNQETTMNECNNLNYGRSCQTKAYEYMPDIPREVYKLRPYGVSYVALYYPFDRFEHINYQVTPATVFEPKVAAFFDYENVGIEAEADQISVNSGISISYTCPSSGPSSDIHAILMIYNTSPYPVDFVVSSNTKQEPTGKPTRPTKPITDPPSVPPSDPPSVPPSDPTSVPTSDPTSVPITHPAPTLLPEPTADSSSDAKLKTVSRNLFLIVSVSALVLGLIVIALSITLCVLLCKKKKTDANSSSVMLSLSKNLL